MPLAADAELPSLSAVDALINGHTQSVSCTNDGQPTHAPELHQLAVQVLHNLQYQHDWTDLTIHTHSPSSSASSRQDPSHPTEVEPHDSPPLPRPLISGLPPRRIYIHPDEQIAHIKAGVKERDLPRDREWVLPTRIKERWSLKKLAEVFDGITVWPPPKPGKETNGAFAAGTEDGQGENKWRKMKRVLLATVDDDSTVVYYIVHDGIVKPRQN